MDQVRHSYNMIEILAQTGLSGSDMDQVRHSYNMIEILAQTGLSGSDRFPRTAEKLKP
jgi:hypothetical protein